MPAAPRGKQRRPQRVGPRAVSPVLQDPGHQRRAAAPVAGRDHPRPPAGHGQHEQALLLPSKKAIELGAAQPLRQLIVGHVRRHRRRPQDRVQALQGVEALGHFAPGPPLRGLGGAGGERLQEGAPLGPLQHGPGLAGLARAACSSNSATNGSCRLATTQDLKSSDSLGAQALDQVGGLLESGDGFLAPTQQAQGAPAFVAIPPGPARTLGLVRLQGGQGGQGLLGLLVQQRQSGRAQTRRPRGWRRARQTPARTAAARRPGPGGPPADRRPPGPGSASSGGSSRRTRTSGPPPTAAALAGTRPGRRPGGPRPGPACPG